MEMPTTPMRKRRRPARSGCADRDEFRRIDFDVDFKENLNKQNMQNAVAAFLPQ
jgi:hypothetical protein